MQRHRGARPALSFIDLSRVLVFARPGRSSADGAYASCHSLGLPTSDPAISSGATATRGEVTRRTEWFVTKSPEVYVDGRQMNYMISFALPRFTDQTLSRSRKRSLYPAGRPTGWRSSTPSSTSCITSIPSRTACAASTAPTAACSDALHNATYFEDVAALVQQYLATQPDARLLEFLQVRLRGAARRATAASRATTFRSFPSYPRRYREAVAGQPLPPTSRPRRWRKSSTRSARIFGDDDLQMREFTGQRLAADRHYPPKSRRSGRDLAALIYGRHLHASSLACAPTKRLAQYCALRCSTRTTPLCSARGRTDRRPPRSRHVMRRAQRS